MGLIRYTDGKGIGRLVILNAAYCPAFSDGILEDLFRFTVKVTQDVTELSKAELYRVPAGGMDINTAGLHAFRVHRQRGAFLRCNVKSPGVAFLESTVLNDFPAAKRFLAACVIAIGKRAISALVFYNRHIKITGKCIRNLYNKRARLGIISDPVFLIILVFLNNIGKLSFTFRSRKIGQCIVKNSKVNLVLCLTLR